MVKRPIGAISFGVFLAICGVAGFAYAANLITPWETVPLVAVLYGIWAIILAAIKHASPEKYEMGAFVVGIWGAIMLGGGALWFLSARISVIAALAGFVVLIGILTVAAGFRAWGTRKK